MHECCIGIKYIDQRIIPIKCMCIFLCMLGLLNIPGSVKQCCADMSVVPNLNLSKFSVTSQDADGPRHYHRCLSFMVLFSEAVLNFKVQQGKKLDRGAVGMKVIVSLKEFVPGISRSLIESLHTDLQQQ